MAPKPRTALRRELQALKDIPKEDRLLEVRCSAGDLVGVVTRKDSLFWLNTAGDRLTFTDTMEVPLLINESDGTGHVMGAVEPSEIIFLCGCGFARAEWVDVHRDVINPAVHVRRVTPGTS